MKMSPVISVNAETFERGFAAHGPMYANLPSYHCYMPASACVPPPPPWTPSKLTADWWQTNCNHGNQLFGKSSVGGCGGGGWIGLWVSRPDKHADGVCREK